MTRVRHHRLAATALVAGLVLTACGQKPGIHVDGSVGGQVLAGGQQTGGSTATGTQGATPSGEAGTASGAGGAASASGSGASAGGSGGGAKGGASTGGGAGAQQDQSGAAGAQTEAPPEGGEGGGEQPAPEQEPQQQGARQVTGSDRTGVTDSSITVAFHAPVTGAAPLPAESFREARDLYWRKAAADGRTFLGRESVEVLFQDDKYDPANARQVCRQLASEAFIVGGGGGTDQIQACGQLAGVQSFPYFSAGVTEAGLQGNPWYFASSMTYRQQGLLLAQYIAKTFPDRKFAAVVTKTANFDDAVQGFEQGVQQAGIEGNYVQTLRHPKGDNSWYNSYAQQLNDAGVEVVYILTSPVDYIQFAQQARQSGYGPREGGGFQYVGVGVSMGLNAVLNSGCNNNEVDDGIFFSPFPGLDWAQQNVPEFFEASKQFGTVADDLALALWGINKQLDTMFQRYEETFGTDLTREDFRALVESGGPVQTGIFPDVAYAPDNHFGGQSVHVLQANCDTKQYETLATFATGF